MIRNLLLLLFCCFLLTNAFATHIAGGELFYEYMGPGATPGNSLYKVTMRLFRECSSTGQTLETESVTIGIYNGETMSEAATPVYLPRQGNISSIRANSNTIPCLSTPVDVCYQVGIFSADITLPDIPEGYILSWIRYSRQNSVNIANPSGAIFITSIPGTKMLPQGQHNSSPEFVMKDTVLVCRDNNFNLDFSAKDPDSDSLSYAFCTAYTGGNDRDPNPAPTAILSLTQIRYTSGFSGTSPLGSLVKIDPRTGKISGKAPAVAGGYVVNVCVTEWRNGVAINVHHKDFILKVGNCDFAAAMLPEKIMSCDSFTASFENGSLSSSILGYLWDFGDKNTTSDTSTNPTPTHTFKDTGIYAVKLIVYGKNGCVDSGVTNVYVYPGFTPNFTFRGSCYQSPFYFSDASVTRYGTVNSWDWDFGDLVATNDTSHLKNPAYLYPDTSTRTVTFTARTSKGCEKTITKAVVVRDRPDGYFAFRDTLICNIDTLQLIANTTAAISWQPSASNVILNPDSYTPLVFPKKDTWFVASLTENGCKGDDSVLVRVIDKVLLNLGPDTTICATDTIHFNPATNALYFNWAPLHAVSDPDIANPFAVPVSTSTTYQLHASVGKCFADDQIVVRTAPYPKAYAGLDTSICFGTSATLHGTVTGAYFSWNPPNLLLNPRSLNPQAAPTGTTSFILTVTDNAGCPKPVSDTMIINVIPQVRANAGRDTNIVAGQPLQLNATGGNTYYWSPSIGMNNPLIPNPVVTLGASYDSIRYRVRVSIEPPGCFAEDDIKVTIFKTAPDIFIPTAFTPNGDGRNDILRPVLAGMQRFNYFRIYNRWGQLLFSTTEQGAGWDGSFGSQEQPAGTYVFMAQGVDYQGKVIDKKGTVVLIR
ncbi:PKD domain-containing protein [Danxiaibacter flavus]|uniref:PKD domain-containing protein n=1 Tax=Danxiaibacter flavus TaxID=3049108 RepID=A0ABV3ZE72_9BACT|nr:PKD domain-containing protein [Chitinophagaceae bacterium DXS]